MFKYQKLGFVNSKKILEKAMKGGYAVPAYNFNNMEQLQAITEACLLAQSPVILQVSKGARDYADPTMLIYMAEGAIEMMKRMAKEKKLKPISMVLHLDHGADFAICKSAIDSGFSSVMIDGSSLSYKENVAVTKKVVAYAHKRGVTVEGELGVLAGVEDEVKAKDSQYTDPEQAKDFVKKTGVDSLAISIGTSHGAYKFKPGQTPKIRLDILEKVKKALPGFPIVLHGASSIPQSYVAMVNKYGGDLASAQGIAETDLRKAARSAVCKINVDSDGRLVMTGMVRKIMMENKKEFDPRKYLGPAREALRQMYLEKINKVFGSNKKV